MVVIPYVGGLSEAVDRVFRKHKITTATMPIQASKGKKPMDVGSEDYYNFLLLECFNQNFFSV